MIAVTFPVVSVTRAFLEALRYVESHHNEPVGRLDATRWAQPAS